MQIAIQGTFENGQIKLKSLPPPNVKKEIIVIFEVEDNKQTENSEDTKNIASTDI